MTNFKVTRQTRESTTMSKRGKFFDYTLLIVVLFVVAFGLIMIYSAGSYLGMISDSHDSASFFKSQLRATVVGLVFMVVAMVVNNRVWYKLAPIIYVVAVLSIFLVLTPLGIDVNGAKRWIKIGGMSIQPAEIVKLGLIAALAAFVTYSGKNMRTGRNTAIYIILTMIPALLILFVTKNMSTAIIILGIGYVMLIVSKPNNKAILIVTGALLVGLIIFLIIFFNTVDEASGLGFRFRRILAWRNPEKYITEEGYQTIQSLYAIGSGGFFGKGLGSSMQKLGFVPEAANDMIFSIICEELGLFGALCVITLFVIMLWRLMVIATNSPDLYSAMFVVGVLAHIGIQVVLNIAVVTNTIPNTGVTLPFISYGGTSALCLLVEMGIVLNVSYNIRVPVSADSDSK